MASYFDSLPNSFTASTVVGKDKLPLSTFDFKPTADGKVPPGFGLDAFTLPSDKLPFLQEYFGWSFITAPEDISWDVANQATRIDIFGTNNPPVVAGSRGMRDLTLGNALVEGFVRNVTIEGKLAALENLMSYKLNQTDGFVSVPVYQVWANEKAYGNGYFIIKDVRIKETMRDLKGDATRAYVDISLMEVPAYQVNSGRDQATATTAGVKSSLISEAQARNVAGSAKASDAAAKNQVDNGANKVNAGNKSGPNAASPGRQPTPVDALNLNVPQRIVQ